MGLIGRIVTVTVYQIGKLFGIAYMKADTVQSAVEGFEKTLIGVFS